MRYITICADAWKLYDIWMATIDARPVNTDNTHIAQMAYYNHRDSCPLCSPMVKDNDRPAPTTPLQGETV